jgi:hypothetical protein
MSKGKLIAGLLGLGVVVAVLASGTKKAKAAEAPKSEPPLTPEKQAEQEKAQEAAEPAAAAYSRKAVASRTAVDFANAVVAALSTGNPDTVRRVAGELAAAGYAYGDQLRAIADDMEKAAKARGATRASVTETLDAAAKQPEITKQELPATEEAEPGAEPAEEPEGPPPAQPSPATMAAGKADAEQLAAHLRPRAKGTEDRALVKAYQTRHGLKVDGLFGPQTASDVASYGVVPPVKNIYWPADWQQAKRDLAATLLQYAQQFPAAAAAFTAEARSIK